MILSKKLLVCSLICLGACTFSKKEKAEAADSTKTDSVAALAVSSEGGVAFDIESSVASQDLNIFGKNESVVYWMSKLYAPDHLTSKTDTVSAYQIKSVELIDNEYSNAEGKCVSRPVVLVLRYLNTTAEEFFDVHFVSNKNDFLSERVTYEGTIAQTEGTVSLSNDYKLSENCSALTVMRSYEGGDIDLGRTKEISLFISTESGMVSVFDLTLEHTSVRDYEVSGDENKNSTSEIREFEILNKKSNNLRDIAVHTTVRKDGEVTEETNSVFRFDGEKYSEHKN